MEGFYSPSALLKAQHDYREIAEAIYRSKISFGIAALSDTYDNELMWTHYADQYRGICVQYYAERMFNQLPPNCTLARIGYVNQPTRISTAFDRSFDEAALRILSQKKSSWAYEREWRVLGPVGEVRMTGLEPVVRGVYLGARIRPGHKQRILRAFEGTNVDVWSMTIDGYDHFWDRIQDAEWRKRKARKKKAAKKKSSSTKAKKRK
ncbi:DUF2971 domain-containing protein [Bradyrhizobium diazoefficiens]|uniref:DUF2971 domain-containing protein n=1 Tax=Bradyrhizobium diazoefficiens TaxID=1355477 RepID=UPI00384FD297